MNPFYFVFCVTLVPFILLLIAGRVLDWNFPKFSRQQRKVYACEGTNRLFWYHERWNIHGHRSARQDWWCEVVQVRPGVFQSIENFYKDNVGYYAMENRQRPGVIRTGTQRPQISPLTHPVLRNFGRTRAGLG